MSILDELNQVENEIVTIYRRACSEDTDAARLKHLRAQQTKLTTARRKERAAQRRAVTSQWDTLPGRE